MLEQINSIGKVIEVLGGDAELARRLRVTDVRVVWNWRARGFPRWTFLMLKAELEAEGKTAPDRLWGMGRPTRAVRAAS